MAAPSPRAPVAWLLLPLIGGYLFAGGLPNAPKTFALTGLTLACAALVLAGSPRRWIPLVWAAVALTGGALLAAAFYQHRLPPPPDWAGLPPREARVTIEVTRLYGSARDWQVRRGLATIREADPHLADLVGQKAYFTVHAPPEDISWIAGTRLQVTGIIELVDPAQATENEFLTHLIRSGVHFHLSQVDVRSNPAPPRWWAAFFAAGNDRFERLLRRGSAEKGSLADVHVAMLLGKRAELAPDQRQRFLQTGTLHLFAISGLHIGVIAMALHTLLMILRVPPKPGAILGLALLGSFVGITGASPSAVRAFLMVLFFWGARFFVRSPNPVAALANSAFLVLLLFPAQLWSPGFQLSYAVVSGILLLGLPLAERLQERWMPFQALPENSWTRLQKKMAGGARWVFLTVAISLSATLLSSPLSIHYFGIFAPGAALLNLVLIPMASLVIVSGFISVCLGLSGLGFVSPLFNHAAWVVIAAMEWVVEQALLLPGLFWHARFLSPVFGGGSALVVIGSILLCSNRRWREPGYHFVLPFLVFVLLLLTLGRLTFPGG